MSLVRNMHRVSIPGRALRSSAREGSHRITAAGYFGDSSAWLYCRRKERDDTAQQRVIVPYRNPQQRADWTFLQFKEKRSLHWEVDVWSAETVFVCALTLLGRTERRFPLVEFVERVPSGLSPLAQAYARPAESRIVLVTSTSAFVRAREASTRCGELDAVREIAGVLAHEEWHLLHGPDEQGAYEAQLIALTYTGAGPTSPLYSRVARSMHMVRETSQRATDGTLVTRRRTP